MVCVTRPYDGITINEEVEYLLDDDGNIMYFPTENAARDYLRDRGLTDDDMEYLNFEEEVKGE